MKKPELLAPAGNLEKLKTAIDFGADAVYLGGNRLNLRAFADNFTDNELTQGIRYAHVRGKKAFITVNVFPHNDDLKGLEDYLKKLYKLDVDGIIVSDPGIIMTARQTVPDLELHLSTQSNSVNWMSALFWYKQGIRRIVLARELSLKEIKEIRQHLPEECEIEAFVHGAMCMSYSGRCMLSNYMTGRDSNRGQCAQPCRYKYYLMEEKRPGEYFPVFEDTEGDYILNSKDLCMIEYIPELVGAGINSFKIEGRMKSAYYVATVVKAYRRAMDAYLENPDKYVFKEKWLKDLMKASHRKYFTGFYFGDKESQIYENSSYIRNYDIVGVVRDYDRDNGIAVVEQRNKVFDGDIVEVLRPEGDGFTICLENMKNEEEENIESAPVAQMIFTASVDRELKKGDMLIKSKNSK
ncbi:peptidase U32 family protein [Clostridium luticellarii]|jgi:putative protease|uniref:Putative protease YhbU n=1 Tax=Clostridium luticellarii TaxID=1691940 RepID=A0A2T0BRF6_9CLOT|nr:U32 family peptidase [Clostridium luticellarii]MCI1943822.1 U32 family peptidase [Clostridium luticellarii]MCI1967083.1 U32 family peptidase [Clostridium luticellarii]MCI1994450.1 U32 family peptidase [Clostridium luticellarii]MCI2038597.1 U32 family peptidase [Clostridium luticellarii]PRR86471.1 putative protease YhbU precursor [Clostridium luticellarii]